MKKITSFLLSLIICVLLLPLAAFAADNGLDAEEPENAVIDLSGEIVGTPIDLSSSEDSTAAIRFVALSDVLKIEICCPTWNRKNGGNFTMSLFKFDKDYESTVSAAPIVSQRFEEFDDNQWLCLAFDESSPLGQGEYIVVLSEPVEGQASGIWMDKATEKQLCYTDGLLEEGRSIRSRITFKGNPENTLGTPEKPKPETHEEEFEKTDAPYIDMTVIFNDPDWDFIISPQGGATAGFDEEYLTVTVVPGSDDPQVHFRFDDISSENGIYVKQYPYMLLKVRRNNETDPTDAEIFFLTDTSPNPKGGNSFYFKYEDSLDWQYVLIDLSTNPRCKDYLTGIRYDVFNHAPDGGVLDIAWITFFQSEEAAKNFDGDFSKYIPEKTEPPKPTETLKPDPTALPTDAPAETDVPQDSTAKPVTSEKPENESKNSSLPLILSVAGGVIAIAAVIIAIVMKKHGSGSSKST